MKLRVSHEVPLQLLNDSKQFNDYDYCLPHLLDIHPEYEDYFRRAKKEGRYIIMDNSLHELGEAYDTKRLMYWVNELKPNEFIVPDVWENSIYSIRNAKHWSKVELPEEVTKVAVVQGKSYSEFASGYQSYKWFGYEKIAFSYGASWFQECFQHPNPIIHGLEGIRYSEGGLLQKSNQKIDKDFTQEVTPKQKEDILYNVEMFKKINNI